MTVPAGVVADYKTIQTALAAFQAENPKVMPTKARLLHGFGGPYLRSWPHAHHWAFVLSHGAVMLHHVR